MDPGGDFHRLFHPVQLLNTCSSPVPVPLQESFSQGAPEAVGTIPPNPRGNQTCSTNLHWQRVLFLVLPSPGEKWRKKTNSGPQALNTLVCAQWLRMVILAMIIPSLDPGDWFVSIKLQDSFIFILPYIPHANNS